MQKSPRPRRCRGVALALAIAIALSSAGCAPRPVRSSLASAWWPSSNFNERRPNYIVLHHTGSSSLDAALVTLSSPDKQVSVHYVVARDGRIVQLVDERARAWHAGDSRWGPITDMNSASIGIELDNDGVEAFPAVQITALIALLRDICARERIPAAHVIGHADVAPGRKTDPSAMFPWDALAAAGFGFWCAPPLPAAADSFDTLIGLQSFGYDVSDAAAALRAFRLHFNRDETSPLPTEHERALVQCLSLRAGS